MCVEPHPSNSATSLTLLGRLRDSADDPGSWDEFVDRYGSKIRGWCRQWGLQAADAEDVTQDVLLALSRQMRTFEYRPSGRFRSWLRTVAYRAWVDYLERDRRKATPLSNPVVFERLTSDEAREAFLEAIEDECNRELLELAVQRVQPRVQPSTWEAFRLMTFEQLNAGEVARRLQTTKGAVFVARGRVQKMLMDEVQSLDRQKAEK